MPAIPAVDTARVSLFESCVPTSNAAGPIDGRLLVRLEPKADLSRSAKAEFRQFAHDAQAIAASRRRDRPGCPGRWRGTVRSPRAARSRLRASLTRLTLGLYPRLRRPVLSPTELRRETLPPRHSVAVAAMCARASRKA